MDVFERIQELRPEIEGVDENLDAARGRLMTEIGAEARAPKKRAARRPWIIVGGLAGAAAAVTAGVLAVNALTAPPASVEAVPTRAPGTSLEPTPAPSPTPAISTGADALRGAAIAAAQFVPPTLAPGQYLRRSWTHEELLLYNPSADSEGWSAPGLGVARASATGGWVLSNSGVTYSPADPRSAWYAESGPSSVVAAYGDGVGHHATIESVVRLYGQGTQLYSLGGAPTLDEGSGETILWYFDTMPRDPQAMVDWATEYFGEDRAGWVEGKVGWLLIKLLAYNEGDPGMRSAMYQALSLLPGSTVGPESGGRRTVTFDSRLAGSGEGDTSLSSYTVTIEMSTGLVTEVTTTSDVGEGMIPGSVPDTRNTYTMSVVDSLP